MADKTRKLPTEQEKKSDDKKEVKAPHVDFNSHMLPSELLLADEQLTYSA